MTALPTPKSTQDQPASSTGSAVSYSLPAAAAGPGNANGLTLPVSCISDDPSAEEFCLDCEIRDQDMADVDVTSPGVWERESDFDFEELKHVEEEEAIGITSIESLYRPKSKGTGALTAKNLELFLSTDRSTVKFRQEALSIYIGSQRRLLESEALRARSRALCSWIRRSAEDMDPESRVSIASRGELTASPATAISSPPTEPVAVVEDWVVDQLANRVSSPDTSMPSSIFPSLISESAPSTPTPVETNLEVYNPPVRQHCFDIDRVSPSDECWLGPTMQSATDTTLDRQKLIKPIHEELVQGMNVNEELRDLVGDICVKFSRQCPYIQGGFALDAPDGGGPDPSPSPAAPSTLVVNQASVSPSHSDNPSIASIDDNLTSFTGPLPGGNDPDKAKRVPKESFMMSSDSEGYQGISVKVASQQLESNVISKPSPRVRRRRQRRSSKSVGSDVDWNSSSEMVENDPPDPSLSLVNKENPTSKFFHGSQRFSIDRSEFNAVGRDAHSSTTTTNSHDSSTTIVYNNCTFSDSVRGSPKDGSTIKENAQAPPTNTSSFLTGNPRSNPPQAQHPRPNLSSSNYFRPTRRSRWSIATFMSPVYYYIQPVMLYLVSWLPSSFEIPTALDSNQWLPTGAYRQPHHPSPPYWWSCPDYNH